MSAFLLRLAGLGLLWLFSALSPALAVPSRVTVLLGEEAPPYQEFVQRFRSELQSRGVAVMVRPMTADVPPSDLVVSLGVRATEQALRLDPPLPVLATLLPRSAYLQLKARHQGQAFSALFLDQPPARRLGLIAEALPDRRRVGVLLGPESLVELRGLQTAARERGMTLVSERIDDPDALLPALQRVLAEADVLLAVPDPLVFNRNTAQAILLTTYRLQKPVVAYSQAYVNAGALLAVYSTPAQIARQAAEIVLGLSTPLVLPAAEYPRYFSVGVNGQVARSLGLTLEPERALLEKLDAGGGKP